MSHLATAVSNAHTYRGNSEINFITDEQGGLSVTIDTERLHIRSVEAKENEYDRYAALFGDKAVMEKFATGQTKSRDEMKKRIQDTWAKRWKEGDPYTGLAVFKTDTDDFLGHVVLGHGDRAGESELAYLFNRAHWGKGFGSEAVTAVVKEYAPATVEEGYFLEGKPLERIVATARTDNPASVRILEKAGMKFVREGERHGAPRRYYSLELNHLQKKSSDKASGSWCLML